MTPEKGTFAVGMQMRAYNFSLVYLGFCFEVVVLYDYSLLKRNNMEMTFIKKYKIIPLILPSQACIPPSFFPPILGLVIEIKGKEISS